MPIFCYEVAQLQIFFINVKQGPLRSNIHFKARQEIKTHEDTHVFTAVTYFWAIFDHFLKKIEI